MELMDVTHLTPMSEDESAALLFVCGDQYLFRYRTRDGGTAFKFLSASAVRAAFAEEAIDTYWLPQQVRRCGIGRRGEWVIVAQPPQRYSLLFQGETESEPTRIDVPMPGLAFLGYGQRYCVWSFKDKELRGETILFAAPLPNVDANGAICFGTNLVPPASTKTIEDAWKLFFATPFTSHSVDRKSNAYPEDVRKQLNRLVVGKHRRYPLSDLVSTNRTANMAIDWILRGID